MLYKDSDTNKVYFSNLLRNNYSNFSKELFGILNKHNINHELIPNTKDIWMRDYMPIQRSDGHFIRYVHNPDYLEGFSKIRTRPRDASKFLDINKVVDIELNLDGGNIVRYKDKIICTDKIFKANSDLPHEAVINILKSSLGISEVIIIPEQPFDMTGHSDGLVRFIDEDKVMISAYKKEDSSFEKDLITSLKNHDLKVVTLPPKGYFKEKDGAEWIPYINYMQVSDLIILPVVGTKVDNKVIEFFQLHFPTCKIESINATQVIEQGGALNCISWNTYDGCTNA